ncbi:MAG: VOC family protein [Lachnospiraceae bacterium]|nr:VOC family protein [Lachnospiraceae bacterium]
MSLTDKTISQALSWQEQIGFRGRFVHACVIVDDIQKAIHGYEMFTGTPVAKLKQTGEPESAKVMYMGRPTPARAWQTFFNVGDLRVEILQPDDHPSTWREFLDSCGQGIHHVGFEVDDPEEILGKLEKAGIGIIQTGLYNGGKYIYVDTLDQLGMMIELLCND